MKTSPDPHEAALPLSSVLITYPYEDEMGSELDDPMRLRWQIRNQTLQLLADVGIHPTVEVSTRPASTGTHLKTATLAIRRTAGPVLFCEDDIIPSRELLAWLALCDDRLASFCTINPEDTPDVLEDVRQLRPLRRHWGNAPRNWSGSQCLYLPESVADLVRADDAAAHGCAEVGSFDAYLRVHFAPPIVAIPNPVQHASPPSLVERRPVRISITFAHPTNGS